MTNDFDILRSRATLLRERCVAAHNRLLQEAGHSEVAELTRSLAPRIKVVSDSPRLRLISSYAFWGDRRLGGSRRGFERWFRRKAKPAERNLFRKLENSRFVAWKCVDADGDADRAGTWRPVGPDDDRPRQIALVFDGDCNPVDPVEDDVYAGWTIDWDGDAILAFAFRVPDEGAGRLAETADQRGWHDDELDDEAFQRIEYEQDVLTQALRPDWEQCGLGEYYFLSPQKRHVFPKKFRRHLVRTLRGVLEENDAPWHLRFARVPADEVGEWLEPKLARARNKASSRATRFGEEPVDDELLERIVSNRECLEWIGLRPGGETVQPVEPPVETHPVELLDVDEQWMARTGVGPGMSIREARRVLEDRDAGEFEAFDEAVELHRRRLRWGAIVGHVIDNLEGRRQRVLRPGYKELRKVADRLFDPPITGIRLDELLEDRGGTGSRIRTALDNAELGEKPYCVDDLPIFERKLLDVRGIGPSSAQDVRQALLDAMLEWPLELDERAVEVDDEARSEIEEGLDELEDLF